MAAQLLMDTSSVNAGFSRRRFRFGLRALFIVMTVVAIAAAWVGRQVSRVHGEEQAIAALMDAKDGRSITVLFGNSFRHAEATAGGDFGVPALYFKAGHSWLTRLLGADIYRAVVTFACAPPGNTFSSDRDSAGRLRFNREYKTGLTDGDMSRVNMLRHLQFLNLQANGITDRGLAQLGDLQNLETLWLSNTAVTDDGLTALSKFPGLRDLDLRSTDITDASVEVLSKCRRLDKLDLQMTNVSVEGIKTLQQQLPNCRILH